MEKEELQPPSPADTQIMLEMIYAVKTLAENLDIMHKDLRELIETDARARGRDIIRIKEIVRDNAQLLQVLPIQTADRLDRLIDQKVDGVLTDARHSLEELRDKLSYYTNSRLAQQAIQEGRHKVSVPEFTGAVPRRKTFEIFKKAQVLEQVWRVVRWFAALIVIFASGFAIFKLMSRR